MVAHAFRVVLAPIPGRTVAMVLTHDHGLQGPWLDLQNGFETLVKEHVLAPEAKMSLFHAALRSFAIPASIVVVGENIDSLAAEDLQRPMHAVLAIVDVACLLAALQQTAKSVREKHSVRVNLDNPSIRFVISIRDDLLPDGNEDPCVQRRSRVATKLAFQIAVDDRRCHAWCNVDLLVAVDAEGITSEDAGPPRPLPLEHTLLVALGLHQREAPKRPTGPINAAWHLRKLRPRRRNARDKALFLQGLSATTLQPALAWAPIEASVLYPSKGLALWVAMAKGAAHLWCTDVVELGSPPTSLSLVLHVNIHFAASSGKGLDPSGFIRLALLLALKLMCRHGPQTATIAAEPGTKAAKACSCKAQGHESNMRCQGLSFRWSSAKHCCVQVLLPTNVDAAFHR
mmetsp:Transcript_43141/g.85448  ORF Transcript_43141/g.85448 Transcript_43141/m.85448 type:complete len:400 (-) Transcript_43141:136-1335(-)